jgi:hypothetical protein
MTATGSWNFQAARSFAAMRVREYLARADGTRGGSHAVVDSNIRIPFAAILRMQNQDH